MTRLSHDYEWASTVPIDQGLDRYFASPDSRPLLYAYRFDDGPLKLWDRSEGVPFPKEVDEALLDPHVEKFGFNNSFERLATQRRLARSIDPTGWRCSMVLAYSKSFIGTLADVGAQLGLPQDKVKDSRGKKLIRMFCVPQKPTKNQPHVWLDWTTNPVEWEEFRSYVQTDVIAEDAIREALAAYPMADSEWRLYELDQRINDLGLPVNLQFVESALRMAESRKKVLRDRMRDLTGLDNPGSGAQLLPWLKERGYPFGDLQKETVERALLEATARGGETLPVLDLHRKSAKSSTAKYEVVQSRSLNGRLRHCFQFNGASRTGRWAGRAFQPQNLPRTPKSLEAEQWMTPVIEAICAGDQDLVELLAGEPMDALTGAMRASIRAQDGYELRVCDLNAIESRVIGWLAQSEPLLNVFRQGLDPYKAFAVEMFGVPYEQVTRNQRNTAKAPTLGCGFGLGAGEPRPDGTFTGLMGYAAAMRVPMTQDEAKHAVKVFRSIYPEVPALWRELGDGAERCVTTGNPQEVGAFLRFERDEHFLMMRLPSGRSIFYHKPEMVEVWFAKHPQTKVTKVLGANEPRAKRAEEKGWEVYSRLNLQYWGKQQNGSKWVKIITHSGKLTENAVQAVARDILAVGMRRADRDGFKIVGTVHDEIITEQPVADEVRTVERLAEHMTKQIKWAPGLPLGAAGWRGSFYKKD